MRSLFIALSLESPLKFMYIPISQDRTSSLPKLCWNGSVLFIHYGYVYLILYKEKLMGPLYLSNDFLYQQWPEPYKIQ